MKPKDFLFIISLVLLLSSSRCGTICRDCCDICPIDTSSLHDSKKYTELSGSLKTQSLNATKKYLLMGPVFVESDSVLTIPAGTIIFGEKRSKGILVVKVGGKIIAEGTPTNPIIFTSDQNPGARKEGDWGGIVILGRANVNTGNPTIPGIKPDVHFGTSHNTVYNHDNSGILRYVRIEYAGGLTNSGLEASGGLTLASVGDGTTIDYIQVSYSGNDSYEWMGGTVNCTHLIAFAGKDDDFDTDMGYSGNVQFGVSIRDPFIADQSGSNGFECENNNQGDGSLPKTAAVFSNMTIIGPIFDSATAINSNYRNAIFLSKNCELSIFNSIIIGYPVGLNMDRTFNNYFFGTCILDHNILVCPAIKGRPVRTFCNGSSTDAGVEAYWNYLKSNQTFTQNMPQALSGSLKYSKAIADVGIDPGLIMGFNTLAGVSSGTYPKNPNLASFTGISQSGADFSNAKLSFWFSKYGAYRGAFGTNDWTENWSDFNTQYMSY